MCKMQTKPWLLEAETVKAKHRLTSPEGAAKQHASISTLCHTLHNKASVSPCTE